MHVILTISCVPFKKTKQSKKLLRAKKKDMQVDKGEVLARGGAEEVAGWDVVHAQENVTFRCEGDVTHKPPPRLEMEI